MGTVRNTATVTVSEPVDGRRRSRRPVTENRRLASTTGYLRVDPAVMAQARRLLRPGQRLEIVSEREVRLVNH